MGLRSDLLAVVLRDLPDRTSTLSETSQPDRWDHLLGGKIGPGRWGRYEAGYGTTCGVTVDGWLLDVGAPAAMINAQAPGGSGFKIGDHIARINVGAEGLGWLRTPARGQLPALRPGDVYEINRDRADGLDGTHVGVVRKVTVAPDGQSMEVETADGGQGSLQGQFAGVNVRTFSISNGPHAVAVHSPSGDGWLDRWVAVGGDAADSVADMPGDSTTSTTASSDGGWWGALALAAAGAGVLGVAWATWGGGWGAPHAAVDAWFTAAGRDHRGDPLWRRT